MERKTCTKVLCRENCGDGDVLFFVAATVPGLKSLFCVLESSKLFRVLDKGSCAC